MEFWILFVSNKGVPTLIRTNFCLQIRARRTHGVVRLNTVKPFRSAVGHWKKSLHNSILTVPKADTLQEDGFIESNSVVKGNKCIGTKIQDLS